MKRQHPFRLHVLISSGDFFKRFESNGSVFSPLVFFKPALEPTAVLLAAVLFFESLKPTAVQLLSVLIDLSA